MQARERKRAYTGELLFYTTNFDRGGAEMSSARMMNALVGRGWRVTFVVVNSGGSLVAMLDPRIVIKELRPCRSGTMVPAGGGDPAAVPWGQMRAGAVRLFCSFLGSLKLLGLLQKDYDAAAILLTGTSSWFVRRLVRAKVRIRWIRNDLAHMDPEGRIKKRIENECRLIDWYVCVSRTAKASLVCAVPAVKDKAKVIYNLIGEDQIRYLSSLSGSPFADDGEEVTKILTVCRLHETPKELLRMVAVCKRLAALGYTFKWYIVGDGPDRGLLSDSITSAGQSDRMVLLGRLANPFPAYLHADVVAMLSRYEGLSGVVNEARILGRPVIATRVSGIDEQLTHGVNGLVVDNNEESILAGMERMLTDHELRLRLGRGGYPRTLMDDEAKLIRMESVFRNKRICE